VQVVVTSFKRLKYLKRTVESLRQDDVELIIVDDGSNDPEIEEYIVDKADIAILCSKNRGADFSKNTGLVHATEELIMVTSDDLVYPKGYSKLLEEQYKTINRDELKYMFMACNMHSVDRVSNGRWIKVNGVEIRCTGKSQVAGAMFNTKTIKEIGGWPIYGKSGAGDRALSYKLGKLGYRLGYFRTPMIQHIGSQKYKDFPEYSEEFRRDHLNVMRIANNNGLNK